MNTRTLVSLPDDDKQWLDQEAAARGMPMTHLVQDAVAEYRVRARSRRAETLDDLLGTTAGLFTRRAGSPEDGATLQRRLRAEWRDPPVRRARATRGAPS
jgi:hypothetical protein